MNETTFTTTHPRDIDILCGNGFVPYHHPGNVAFRKLIESRRSEYHLRHGFKQTIAKSVIAILQSKGVRFLRKAKYVDSCWVEIDYELALRKTSQALRQGPLPSWEAKKRNAVPNATLGKEERKRNAGANAMLLLSIGPPKKTASATNVSLEEAQSSSPGGDSFSSNEDARLLLSISPPNKTTIATNGSLEATQPSSGGNSFSSNEDTESVPQISMTNTSPSKLVRSKTYPKNLSLSISSPIEHGDNANGSLESSNDDNQCQDTAPGNFGDDFPFVGWNQGIVPSNSHDWELLDISDGEDENRPPPSPFVPPSTTKPPDHSPNKSSNDSTAGPLSSLQTHLPPLPPPPLPSFFHRLSPDPTSHLHYLNSNLEWVAPSFSGGVRTKQR